MAGLSTLAPQSLGGGSSGATAMASVATSGISQTLEIQNACLRISSASAFQIGVKDGLGDEGWYRFSRSQGDNRATPEVLWAVGALPVFV